MRRTAAMSSARAIRRGARPSLPGALALVALVSLSCSVTGPRGPATTARAPSVSTTAAAASDSNSPLPRWLLGHDWERIPTRKRIVALTFDAGSNAAGLPSIRRTLSARRVPATFFLTGQWARGHPAQARALAVHYRLGNHSMTHPHFTALTNRQIRSQLTRAASAIRTVSGVTPRPLFRFPYGDRNTRTIAAVNAAGYVPVRWTVDTLGWEGTRAGITVGSVVRRVMANLRPGEIVLMHVGANPDDHSTLDANALPRVISRIRARGYAFVTLNALLTAR